MGAGDCRNRWLPVSPVTTTSDSFTPVSVMGLCLMESDTTCPLADVHKDISNIECNIVFIEMFYLNLLTVNILHLVSKIRRCTSLPDIIRASAAPRAGCFADDVVMHAHCRQHQYGRRQIGHALQLAKHAVVHGVLQGKEVPIVVHVVRTVLTRNGHSNILHSPMMVERNGNYHGHIHQ